MPEVEGEGLLRLEVGYHGAPDLRSSSQILDRLANAFTQGLRGNGGNHYLQITRIEIGSLRAWLDVAGAVDTLYQQREMLGRFVEAVAVAVQTAIAGGVDIPPSIRNLLISFVAPIRSDRASHVRLQVHGNNNTIVYIERAGAEEIDLVLARFRPSSSRGSTAVPAPASEQEQMRRWIARDGERSGFRQESLEFDRGVAHGVDYALRTPDGRPVLPEYDRPLPSTAPDGSATLLHVGVAWYARPTELNGVLLPVDGSGFDAASLDPALTYVASGSVVRDGADPRAFRVQLAVASGAEPATRR